MSTKVLEPATEKREWSIAREDRTARRSQRRSRRKQVASRTTTHHRASALLCCADVVIDLARQRATRAGRQLALSPQDLGLLVLLVRQAGKTVTRQRLAREIWRRAHDGRSNFIEVGMWRLRTKLDGPQEVKLLHAVRGVGYICAVRSGAP